MASGIAPEGTGAPLSHPLTVEEAASAAITPSDVGGKGRWAAGLEVQDAARTARAARSASAGAQRGNFSSA